MNGRSDDLTNNPYLCFTFLHTQELYLLVFELPNFKKAIYPQILLQFEFSKNNFQGPINVSNVINIKRFICHKGIAFQDERKGVNIFYKYNGMRSKKAVSVIGGWRQCFIKNSEAVYVFILTSKLPQQVLHGSWIEFCYSTTSQTDLSAYPYDEPLV